MKQKAAPAFRGGTGELFFAAVWFAVVAGLVEGVGLLIFQRINWAQWARVLHVSKEILWISPAVDLVFFLLIALAVALLLLAAPRLPGLRIAVFLFTFLTAYDWLLVTGRVYQRACLLLALGTAVAFTRWLKKHEGGAIAFWKRSTPFLFATLLLLIGGIEGGKRLHESYATSHLPSAAAGSPNVLLIVVDTLRADHVSSYGYGRQTTPQIDRLAARGVLFENAIAASSWSLPSHASLLTGLTVNEHGLGNVQPTPWLGWGRNALNGAPTVAEALQERGYRTGAFSANRIYFTSNVGLGRGFLHFEDYFDSIGDGFIRTEFGRQFARLYLNRSSKSKFTRVFQSAGLARWLDKDSEGSGEYGGAFGIRKRADEVNREALQWIKRDPNHPFFAFLTYLDVHYSYGGPSGYAKPDWDRGTAIEEYDAGLKYEDDYIGKLLADMDSVGILKNTVVIVTSDHGESLGDHGLTFHGAAVYWELIHVPLIFHWPGHLPEGMRIQQPVSNAAIAATVLQVAGGGAQSFPAPSLSTLWHGPDRIAPGAGLASGAVGLPVLSELPQTNTIVKADRAMQGKEPLATDGWMKSVITERWHLITHEKDGDQIYDWKADPKEATNLIHTPEGGKAALRLKNSLSASPRSLAH